VFPETISTTRLILRPVTAGDAQAIFDTYAQDADVTRYLTWRPHRSIEDAHTYVQTCLAARSACTYMIVLRATGRVIGAFDLRKTGPAKLDYGYVLGRPFWGQGLMTEVVDWALRQPAVWRIGAAVDLDNVGSIRVMEKAGLQREGVFRRWLIHPNISDIPRDCLIFSRTR
jgi:RimJ/RimL family protein N-acetyltransferase